MSKRSIGIGVIISGLWLIATACSNGVAPHAPSPVSHDFGAGSQSASSGTHSVHAGDQPESKGYLDGWFEGADVRLYYTKAYYCAEPPASGAVSDCEIGAPGQEPPRPGPIPTIYAIAAVGFTPPAGTAACRAGTPCLNHPAMIDLSRVGGPASAAPVSHNHILSAHRGGWFNTVNIRVFSPAAWNEIAAAKTLTKVRQLQGDSPQVGTPGVISADTPTNIYFFIASSRPN